MEKKYQVFVSSTYVDLIDERKEVIQALLELDCIPIGMELFPAADEDQWEFIKSVIDDCDYYVLILAGRYGSCAENGIGYTEMEYQYALETNKPIISFIHSNPGNIPASKIDTEPALVKKLADFKELAQKKLCRYWESPTELGGVLGRSIVQLKKRSPALGWVKASNVPSEGATQEILRLKNQIDELKEKLKQSESNSGGIEPSELAQGEDLLKVTVTATASEADRPWINTDQTYTTEVTWNQLFSELAPILIDETNENDIYSRVNAFFVSHDVQKISQFEIFQGYDRYSCSISRQDFETIIVQFRALGLIQKGRRNRSVKDRQTYWCLTDHGDQVMVGLRAIKK
ncbi:MULTISPECIES: DUF4062 domain-containing protein [Vibrio]|uniref:DUF4062 domain-containing protein n=1 Tax=Vibrio TaxID=662 RepID=UPI000C82DF6F|nr:MULTISPECIES: DUF4062 domain-containing protein [Vibrio]MCC4791169.1 DUF4062 domain-containing protein [Vibrio splendidus]PMO79725.1 hypothetical protein BCT01_10240 [Vibrio tasmaniensis]